MPSSTFFVKTQLFLVFKTNEKSLNTYQYRVLYMAVVNVGSTIGLLGLLTLIPLILLYLIRPRPKVQNIPSLMFFMKTLGSKKLTSFLRRFVRDWLFLIHLLIIFLLASTLAKPYTEYMHDITAQNTVIVLDVSASMQAKENGKTRLGIAVQRARTLLGNKNTVILAKDVPQIGVQDVDAQDAIKYLNKVRAKDTQTRLGDSIILAGEVLAGKEGRIIVLSDFINTAGQDPQIAKAVLESRGLVVDFVNVASDDRSNVGFVDLLAEPASTTVYVKNFDPVQRDITISVGGAKKELTLPANSIETYTFITPTGPTKISLEARDDLSADNTVFLSSPTREKTRALLITNNKSVFLEKALVASGDISLEVAEPPIIPKTQYDVYIIHEINPEQVLPGTFEDIAKKVENGASVIIHAQENSDRIDYKGLSPVSIDGRAEGVFLTVDQPNRFTKNIEFGAVKYYWLAKPKSDVLTIVSAAESPIIAIGRKGTGKTAYYGILEAASDFRFAPGYPIFWTEFIRFMTDQQDIRNLNYRTGDTLILDALQSIETPERVVKKSAIILENAGFYELENGRVYGVSLLNEHESDINAKKSVGAKSTEFELKPVKEKRKFEFEMPFVILGLLLLFGELLYVKRRGDV